MLPRCWWVLLVQVRRHTLFQPMPRGVWLVRQKDWPGSCYWSCSTILHISAVLAWWLLGYALALAVAQCRPQAGLQVGITSWRRLRIHWWLPNSCLNPANWQRFQRDGFNQQLWVSSSYETDTLTISANLFLLFDIVCADFRNCALRHCVWHWQFLQDVKIPSCWESPCGTSSRGSRIPPEEEGVLK